MTNSNQRIQLYTDEEAMAAGAEMTKKFMKAVGILAGSGHLDNPMKSIKTNPTLKRLLSDFDEIDIECVESLLKETGVNRTYGLESVLNKFTSAQKAAFHDSADTCERNKKEYEVCMKEMQGHVDKISVHEGERACLATVLANIPSSPELAQDYKKLEEIKAKLAYQERVIAEKEKKVSIKVKNLLKEKVQEIERAAAEIVKEAEGSENMKKICLANDKIKNMREQEMVQGQNFVLSFKAIGCHNSSLYALENERILTVAALQEAFKAGVEESLPDWEDAMSRVFSYAGKKTDEDVMKLSSAESLCRFLKNIGWDKSPIFTATGNKLIVRRKKTVDDHGRRKDESTGHMILRLQETIFIGIDLPKSAQNLSKRLAAIDAEKEADEENDRKRLRMAPDSTKKRTLDEICPQASEIYAQVLHSANKRRRTEAEDTQGGYMSSPAGRKMIGSNEPTLYQTPQRNFAALDDLNSFSISSKLEKTGSSKGDFQPKNH